MTRQGKRWTINEELSLVREYELLHMYIEDIAKKHQRSCLSIVYKLLVEGLVTDITVDHYKSMKNMNSNKVIEDDMSYDNDSSSDYVDDEESDDDDDDDDYDYEVEDKVEDHNQDDQDDHDEYADMPALIPVDADDISEVDKLTDRVWGLETSVNQIGIMVKTLFDQLSFNNKHKKKLAPLRKTI